jgi:hypothetical protein
MIASIQYTLFQQGIQPDEVLYILGNGFDLAHGIASRYSDFEKWIMCSGSRKLIDMANIFFSYRRDFWNDIETALGEYDTDEILDFCKPDEDFDYDHSLRASAQIEDSPEYIFKPVLEDLKENFNAWVISIDISNISKQRNLLPESKYLTFNYTDTLETIYGIPQSNVLHIHGNRLTDTEFVFGHSNYQDLPEDDFLAVENAKRTIVSEMNNWYKATDRIIVRHESFFADLSNIKFIVVQGHSLSEVDMPYFEKVLASAPHAEWLIECFDNTTRGRATDFASKYNHTKITII